jgi:hypothetical protein
MVGRPSVTRMTNDFWQLAWIGAPTPVFLYSSSAVTMLSASGVQLSATIVAICDWIVATGVPKGETIVPPLSKLNFSTANRTFVTLPSTALMTDLATWIFVSCGMAARCASVALK